MSIGGDSKFIGGANAPFGGGSVYDFGARGISNAGDVFDRVSRGGSIAEAIPHYMNPYTDEVIDRSLADMDKFGQTQLNHLGANATQAGAFGGARHGIAEGTLLGEINQNAGDLASNLRHNGFGTAAGLAGQDVGMAVDAASRGADLGFGSYDLGRTISSDQMQAGGLQQALQQMILDRAGGQFSAVAGQPAGMLDMMMSAIGMSPLNNARTQTQSYTPGLFDYLSLAAGMGSSWLGAQ